MSRPRDREAPWTAEIAAPRARIDAQTDFPIRGERDVVSRTDDDGWSR